MFTVDVKQQYNTIHSLLPWQFNQCKAIKHDKEFKITENYYDMIALLQSNHLKVFISAIYCMHVNNNINNYNNHNLVYVSMVTSRKTRFETLSQYNWLNLTVEAAFCIRKRLVYLLPE